MDKNILVSIIVPVCNVEKYLHQCLESVVNQTLKNVEIILIDDGSTDESLKICEGFASKDARIRIIKQANRGLAAARQAGLEIATGTYIGFVDSDDWLELDMYEKMYNAAAENNVDIVFCNVYRNEDKKEQPYIQSGYYDRQAMEKAIFPRLLAGFDEDGYENTIRWCNWLRLYKKEMIDKHNITFDTRFRRCQDLPFTFLCTIYANSYYYMGEEYLYHNRMNFESLSKGYTKNMWELIEPLIEYLWDKVSLYDKYDFKEQMFMRSMLFAFECADNETKPNNKNSLFRRIKNINRIMCSKKVRRWISNVDFSGMSRIYKMYLWTFRFKMPCVFYAISEKRYASRKKVYKAQLS